MLAVGTAGANDLPSWLKSKPEAPQRNDASYNAHVVREAKDATVKLSDRREFTAKVLGSDPTTDIAVLRIDAKDLPTVRIGDAR